MPRSVGSGALFLSHSSATDCLLLPGAEIALITPSRRDESGGEGVRACSVEEDSVLVLSQFAGAAGRSWGGPRCSRTLTMSADRQRDHDAFLMRPAGGDAYRNETSTAETFGSRTSFGGDSFMRAATDRNCGISGGRGIHIERHGGWTAMAHAARTVQGEGPSPRISTVTHPLWMRGSLGRGMWGFFGIGGSGIDNARGKQVQCSQSPESSAQPPDEFTRGPAEETRR